MKTIAVIGCGRIADEAHFPALSKMEDVRVKYACDLILSKAEAARAKYPMIEETITDYHVALADPEVEAVFVLTPNFAHYTVTMDALRAGKHVFCEKPITISYELACEMAVAAAAAGKILNIGVCNRYHRSVVKLREMVEAGELGKVYHVVTAFRSHRSIPGLGGAFTTKSESGGGVLIDWGIHFLDLILYILGDAKIKDVTCDTYSEMAKDMKSYRYSYMWAEDTADTENGTNDVDDFVTGYVRTDKASISFNGAWAQNVGIEEKYIDILGDKRGVRLEYCGHFSIWDGQTLLEERPEYDIPDMYYEEERAFFESIDSGEKCRTHIDRILESAKLLGALYDSAERQETVKF